MHEWRGDVKPLPEYVPKNSSCDECGCFCFTRSDHVGHKGKHKQYDVQFSSRIYNKLCRSAGWLIRHHKTKHLDNQLAVASVKLLAGHSQVLCTILIKDMEIHPWNIRLGVMCLRYGLTRSRVGFHHKYVDIYRRLFCISFDPNILKSILNTSFTEAYNIPWTKLHKHESRWISL